MLTSTACGGSRPSWRRPISPSVSSVSGAASTTMSTEGSAASRSWRVMTLAQAGDVVGPAVAAEAPYLNPERGEAGGHPAADAAEADHERPLARQLPGRVPLPVPGLLPPSQVGHALDEVQGAHDRELGQRHRVDAARGGGGQAAAVEPGPLHERPDAGAGGLDPAQPAVLGQVRHPGRIEPVEIEEHVRAGRDRPPPRQVAPGSGHGAARCGRSGTVAPGAGSGS